MKAIYILFFATELAYSAYSMTALACPDLNGIYTTPDGAKEQTVQIIQTATTIRLGEGAPDLIIDNTDHTIFIEPMIITYRAACEGTLKMIIKMHAQTQDGQSYEGTKTFTKTSTGFHESTIGFEANEVDWRKVNGG